MRQNHPVRATSDFSRRWCVTGQWAGSPCTTLFDIGCRRDRVVVYPAAVDTYAVTIVADSVVEALAALDAGEPCVLPALDGRRHVRLRPLAGQAVELSVDGADGGIAISYDGTALTELRRALADVARELGRRPW
jgi:hypothetical protein